MHALPQQPVTRYVDAGGVDVAYQVLGTGEDIVYHHGLCHLDLLWSVNAEVAFNRCLAEAGRLILFDRRGTGASDRTGGDHVPSIQDWVDDLLAVLDAAGSERATLVAEAEAGPVAIAFTVAYPERVSRLVLANTYPRVLRDDDYTIGLTDDELRETLGALTAAWGSKEHMRATFPSLVANDDDLEALARLCRAAATPRLASAVFEHVWRDLDVRSLLPDVSVPTLVLHSDGYKDSGDYLARAIPGAVQQHVSSHDYLLFTSREAANAIVEFITGAPAAVPATTILTTLLFTDIADSTAVAARLGDEAWTSLLDEHDRAVRRELGRFGGREIKTTGDGFLATFDSPTRAVRCARAIAGATETLGVPVRVGVHTGECEQRGDDVAGLAVHVANRVLAAAAPGRVLVTDTVAGLVRGIDIPMQQQPMQPLKGLPGEWELYQLGD